MNTDRFMQAHRCRHKHMDPDKRTWAQTQTLCRVTHNTADSGAASCNWNCIILLCR